MYNGTDLVGLPIRSSERVVGPERKIPTVNSQPTRHRHNHQPHPRLRCADGDLGGRLFRRRDGDSGLLPGPYQPRVSGTAHYSYLHVGDRGVIHSFEAAHPGVHRPAFSTDASTTRGRPWRHSLRRCETKRTWTLLATTWWAWCRRRCSLPTSLCGCDRSVGRSAAEPKETCAARAPRTGPRRCPP
jgi:hypothetical protein